MVAQEEEWQPYAPEGRPLEVPELPFKIPGVGTEDTPPGLAQNVPPAVMELKLRSPPSARNSTSFPARPRLEFKNILTHS
jgi:hypothetical protein